ncbi:killer cell lectin-like receptor subfamily G member 1 [Dicentrarchus labrax]|uniref:killer cell lectin-like receptor subfamily G member 1 n=1 Tax=Dicentrarchus labrax TaxID=13489 RepID=UPI0021F65985|nr:killer cell lectin-like receptor subfamily G member 1 [Dicentrarchus labrax]
MAQNVPSCPQGWWRYMNSCYQLSSGISTWHNAKQDCVSKRAHLVIFNDKFEEDVVRVFGGHVSMWIGLRGQQDAQLWTWTWVDGKPMWNRPLPFGNNCQYCNYCACAYVKHCQQPLNNLFQDSCENHHHWMCEKELHTNFLQ